MIDAIATRPPIDACEASQVAHLHLEEMMAPVFEPVRQLVRFHRRYIDDGFLIFRGSEDQSL